MLHLITLHESGQTYNNKQKSWFFGPFSMKPEVFYITSGDLKLLLKAVEKVKELKSSNENDFFNHFNKEKLNDIKERLSYENTMFDSVFGLIFGDSREAQKLQNERILRELQQKLFGRAKELLVQFETDEIVSVREFTMESINVIHTGIGPMHGVISCNFCSEHSPARDVKVFYRTTGSGSWILSNLISHLDRHHSMQNDFQRLPKRRRVMKPTLQSNQCK